MNAVTALQSNTWVLLSHAAGDNDQSMALAEALDRPAVIKHLDWRVANASEDRAVIRRLLAETPEARRWRSDIGLQAPWPRLVICCGRRSTRAGFWIKRQSGGYTKVVCIGRARRPVASYDLLVAPPQFSLPERSNVVNLSLPMLRRRAPLGATMTTPALSVPKPWFTILLGGEVKQFAASEQALMQVARRAQEAADRHGGTVVVSTSRRTPPSLLAAVERVLNRPYIYRWSEKAVDNPYDMLLRQSAVLFVTADSTSMILDCCGSGTPTYVIEYPERLDLRRRWRRDLFRHLRRLIELCHQQGFGRAGDELDRAQDWLHEKGILRYPRDLRLFHAAVYDMGLARSSDDFDPAVLPPRRIANDLSEASGMREAAARCRALSNPFAIAAE